MALNIGEAQAAQVLIRYLVGGKFTREQIVDAAGALAKSASKTMMAGPSEADVRGALERRRLPGLVPSGNRG